jgi:hypothetical protein
MKTALKVVWVVTACFVVTLLLLQAIHVLPAGESTVKTRLKAVFFVMGAICFFLVAATEKDWRWRNWSGGTPMPRWLGQTLFVSAGIILLTTAVLALMGKVS